MNGVWAVIVWTINGGETIEAVYPDTDEGYDNACEVVKVLPSSCYVLFMEWGQTLR